jgi:hypothetical protein
LQPVPLVVRGAAALEDALLAAEAAPPDTIVVGVSRRARPRGRGPSPWGSEDFEQLGEAVRARFSSYRVVGTAGGLTVLAR